MNSNEETKQPKSMMSLLRTGGHWIELGAVVIVYAVIGLMKFEGGHIKLIEFEGFTWFDWVVWGIMTFMPAVISLFVVDAFRKEGISQGKSQYPKLIEEHRNLLAEGNDLNFKVRSEKEFLKEHAARQAIKNFTKTLVVSFLSGQMLIGFDGTSLAKVLINLSMWAFLGLRAMNSSRKFAEEELRDWYVLDNARLKNLRKEEMIKSGKYLGYTEVGDDINGRG